METFHRLVTISSAILTLLVLFSTGISAQESGCPSLNGSECIVMTCQNLARNETVQCLNSQSQAQTLVPQGTIATYRCKGKDLRTYTMMCICHGKWMGIQRYLKYDAWCASTNTEPFAEEQEPALPPSAIMTATTERGRILTGEETTAAPTAATPGGASGLTTQRVNYSTVYPPLESATTSTVTTMAPKNTNTSSSTGEPAATNPDLQASTGIYGYTWTTQPSSRAIEASPTSSFPYESSSSTVLYGPTEATGNTTSENLLGNNGTREGVPESRSLFNGTSNTTAPPLPSETTTGGSSSTVVPTSPGSETTAQRGASIPQTTAPTRSESIATSTEGSTGTTSGSSDATGSPTAISTHPAFTGSTPTTTFPAGSESTTRVPGTGEEIGSTSSSSLPFTATTEAVSTTTAEIIGSTTTGAPSGITVSTTVASITTTTTGTFVITGSTVTGGTTIPSETSTPGTATTVPAGNETGTAAHGPGISNALTTVPEENFTDFQLVGLELHNKYRRAHNVSDVKLNQTLNEKAQSWAENQINQKSLKVTPGTRSYAENLYKVSGWKSITPVRAVREAMKEWYSSIEKYNWTDPNPTGFSQIVWNKTTDIGVGVAKKNDVTVVAVTYWPRGNVVIVGSHDNNSTIDSGKLFRENVFP